MENAIGEFLRARRARISPEAAGIPGGAGLRRVPGLRREEVAQLAGVSVDYYVRLERGRSPHVSDSVLHAVAAVLALDDVEREHLANLARARARGASAAAPGRPRPARPPRLPLHLRRLVDAMPGVPAVVLGRGMDVLGWNEVASAVFDLGRTAAVGGNAARYLFLVPESRALYRNWDAVADEVVAQLRLDVGRHPADPALASLVGELSAADSEFRRRWTSHDVRRKSRGVTVVAHPLVGELVLDYQALSPPTDPDLVLTAYTCVPGSPTDERLRLLTSGGRTTDRHVQDSGRPAGRGSSTRA